MGYDYSLVLKAIDEIPFGVGKKLLLDFLVGDLSNESIRRNSLHKLDSFGSLAYERHEIEDMINLLISKGMVEQKSVKGWKVLGLTTAGKKEKDSKSENSLIKYPNVEDVGINFKDSSVTEEDMEIFRAVGDVLSGFNDEQKKAIISDKEKILCIAGAGSGKTTVLTNRISFLVRYRSVDEKKILAITFTKKAREEMQKRLSKLGINNHVETFNSFCEKVLRNNESLIYGSPVRVIGYKDKIRMMQLALVAQGLNMQQAIDIYFKFSQKKGKSDEELTSIFMNDCFFIRDYFKSKNMKITQEDFSKDRASQLVYGISNFIDAYMKKNGLRDYTDQIVDAISFFRERPERVPIYDHILIDEYQDVNSRQVELLEILSPKNLFAVGDPRQSIYGWRGSDIRFIMEFSQEYKDAQIIILGKNYRSTPHIVGIFNSSIKHMGLPDIKAQIEGEKDIRLLHFASDKAEYEFIIQRILSTAVPRDQIFVLSRTNRQIKELSIIMQERGIRHILKTDEINMGVSPDITEGHVTLSTIHSIKGLEAEMVFIIGCNGANFPCKTNDHPVLELFKIDSYDRDEEEKRLFYVALSRAKKSLYLTYTGNKPTSFINQSMLRMIDEEVKFKDDLSERLREWRLLMSKSYGIPPYLIMTDKTLIELSQSRPLSREDLYSVSGLGPSKIMRFGDQILKVINEGGV